MKYMIGGTNMATWEENVRKVVPYTPGEQPKAKNIIKLNTNENPYPPAPGVERALREMDVQEFRKYPDAETKPLVDVLAEYFQVKPEQVFVGVGSDDVLAMSFLTFFNSKKPILFPDITYSFYDVWADLFHQREKEELKLKLGAKEFLQWLKEQKYRIGLATSTREAVAKVQLKDLGVLHYFDKVVCGDMLKKSKPEPDIYLMACKQLEVLPEESYAVEDSYNGIRAAYNAGMKAIMVPDRVEPNEEMEEKSVVILENLMEVKKWLEKNV